MKRNTLTSVSAAGKATSVDATSLLQCSEDQQFATTVFCHADNQREAEIIELKTKLANAETRMQNAEKKRKLDKIEFEKKLQDQRNEHAVSGGFALSIISLSFGSRLNRFSQHPIITAPVCFVSVVGHPGTDFFCFV